MLKKFIKMYITYRVTMRYLSKERGNFDYLNDIRSLVDNILHPKRNS